MNEKQKKETKQINKWKKQASSKDFSKYFSLPDAKSSRKRLRNEVEYSDFNLDNSLFNIGLGKSYKILTYGCQMNDHDSETMAGILEQIGYVEAKKSNEADVIIINTCAIRENAENKVFGKIGEFKNLKRTNPNLILAVAGCMSQEESVVNKILRSYDYVDLIFGTHNIHMLAKYIKDALLSKETVVEVWNKEGDIIENLPRKINNSIKAWINITYGCDKFCTYCIVPQTRGKERSRLKEDIIAEIQKLAKDGIREITLLGQNVNAYGKDLEEDIDLGKLLTLIDKTCDVERIRFTTSHPWDFNDNLIDALAQGGKIMPYLHLPVQSGNNEMLKKMGRKYTIEMYLDIIEKLKNKVPNLALTTDIIVGFPGETAQEFEDTLKLYEKVGYDNAYTFIYSPREFTPAAKMQDDVSSDDKKNRLYKLNEIVNSFAVQKNSAYENKIVKVLVEGTSAKNDNVLAGYTETQKLVNFESSDKSLIGKVVQIKITEGKTWYLKGELV